ncbi:MAG: efflux transporter outer membrane subunit [Planctomycetes bacterium]|nr:efflux transporter outer membrane subunit [Planctomycetota bacterium]
MKRPAPYTSLAVFAIVLPGMLALAGCAGTSGKDYVRPEIELPAAITGAKPSQAALPRDDWWRTFQDAELDGLVEQARAGNLGLAAMASRIQAARTAARRAGAGDSPRLDVGANYARSRSSENSVSGSAARFGNVADPLDVHSLQSDATWEPDFFGRVSRGAEAAWADAAAMEEDRRAMEVSLTADVAEAWFDVGEADAEIAIHRETVGLLDQTLGLVKSRVDAGLVSELDLRRTEGDLAAARSRIPDPERRRAVAENRLSYLMGKPPGLRAKGRPPASFGVAAEIPVGLPGQLLERRPDVRAAERRLVATNARVGAAVADFYPRFQIVGRAGLTSVAPLDLLKWGSRIWSIAPSVTLPILDGGEREFRQIEAEALHDAQTADWTGTVILALNEIGDAIVSLDARKRTRDAIQATIVAEQRSVELANVRYREGITSYLEVLDAQRALAASRLDLLRSERAVLSEIVKLHRAVGGGWTGAATSADAPSSEPNAEH